jgi:hypothetical protein
MPRPPTSSALAILCGVAISSALSEPEFVLPEAPVVRFKDGTGKMIFSGPTLAPAYSSSRLDALRFSTARVASKYSRLTVHAAPWLEVAQ